jgi:sulfur carrier protein
MVVTVNGEPRELPDGTSVAALLEELPVSTDGRGVAVAVGGEVVPRATWSETRLDEGARVEVVVAVQGG